MIKKRAHIISLVKKRTVRYLKKTHKFGVRVPSSERHASELDREHGDMFWQDAIATEMRNARVAFKILDDTGEVLIGYKCIRCHMIFDVKMENF